jgi:beta-galactosidase
MDRAAALQSVAHGSDTVQYFQFRKSRGSVEKFHGAVVDHVGHENTRVFRDVSQVGERLKKLDAIVGTHTQSRVAVMYEWPNRWAIDSAQGFQRQDKKVRKTFCDHYFSLWKRGINTEVIGEEDDFSQYDLIIAPQLYMTSEELIEKLARFVEKGGTLLCTYMTGMVNENDRWYMGGFPGGKLKDVFGIWNEEIDTLYPDESNTVTMDGTAYKAVDYCELIHPRGAKVLATYEEDFYAGMPAVTVNSYGKGKAYYVAADFDVEGYMALYSKIVDGVVSADKIIPAPKNVSVTLRYGENGEYVFVMNFNNCENTVELPFEYEILSGEFDGGRIAPYGTVILKKRK